MTPGPPRPVGEALRPPAESATSIGKALQVLGLFGPERPQWGASEVARELSVSVPTAHRLLSALADHGYLARFGRGRFRLGLEAISLGRRALASIDLRSLLRPDLQELAGEAGETVLLTVPDDHERASLCIDRFESRHPLRLSVEVGRRTPLHAGASAKAILAYMDSNDVEEVFARPLARLAPGTIIDPDALRAELSEIRDRGYAISIEETDAAAWGVAAPIRSGDGGVVASIGLAGPLHRLNSEMSRRFGQLVVEAAQRAERRLGGREGVG